MVEIVEFSPERRFKEKFREGEPRSSTYLDMYDDW